MVLASKRKDIVWNFKVNEGRDNPNFQGGAYVDDKGYLRILCDNHPYSNKGYVYMHRLVMEKKLGRYLKPHEVIHHINEIKLDNRVANLFLTTAPQHASLHKHNTKKSQEYKNYMRDIQKERVKNRKRVNGKFVK